MLASIQETAGAQRRFVADASHELRAPLTTIRGNLELLRQAPDLSESDRSGLLDDAYLEAERMTSLVGDLLLLARVDAAAASHGRGEAELREQLSGRRELVEMDQLVMDLLRAGQSQLRALRKQIRLSVTTLAPVTVMADPGQLRQLGMILLDNAIKYTPNGGEIRLAVTQTGPLVSLTVSDTGIGIAQRIIPTSSSASIALTRRASATSMVAALAWPSPAGSPRRIRARSRSRVRWARGASLLCCCQSRAASPTNPCRTSLPVAASVSVRER